MKKLLSIIYTCVKAVATALSHISLRGFVIMLGIALALVSPRYNPLSKVDDTFLTLGSFMFSSPRGAADIAIVRVPRKELSVWQSDIHSSGTLAALLSNTLNSTDTVVGVLLDQPIDTGSGAADALIESYLKGGEKAQAYKATKSLVDRKYILMDLLSNKRVVLGVNKFYFSGQKPLIVHSPYSYPIPDPVNRWVWPTCFTCIDEQDMVRVARPLVVQSTFIDTESIHQQILFRSENGDVYPSFIIDYLRALLNIDSNETAVWEQNKALSVGALSLPLSMAGQMVPLNRLSERMRPNIENIPLDEALARSAFPKAIIIAAEGNPYAEPAALSIYSAERGNTVHSPWWTPLLLMALFTIVSLYLVFVSTNISVHLATIVSVSFCFVIVAAQMSFLFFRKEWLPLALPLLWLFAGHFLLSIWVIKQRRVRRVLDKADKICIERAQDLMGKKSLDQAMQTIAACSKKENVLQTMYDISEAYTAEKNYESAIGVLKEIHKTSKSFKDTEQKLQVLTTMLKAMDEEKVEKENLHKTMVIDQPKGPTKLGRYKIENEIGRGAMGQVYLGFDPRIARRVAIKTLSYDAFKGKEINDIKARFFREAEAAGRLSHPSIVSVFDVGEEPGRAYIAMDFAEGRALNHFVNAGNLLPVFEVYRIVHDVAVALEYAHENNIVHRDVKPGNIIYNPSPYQIKVTDFGIARLVDDSKTNTGEILGSPLYMAPEQLKGQKVNRSADIFSLGVTFYQLLTGELPFSGDNLAALTYEIIHGKHKGARSVRKDLPVSASRITNQALQKDVEDRYETAAEMANVIKKAIRRDFPAQAKKMGLT